jgi:precorrin-2 dehydrogenase / sirohydrochlorin ferrochelatase
MLPIAIDLSRLRVILVGGDAAACRRLILLEESGADRLEIYAVDASPALVSAAGERLRRRLPRAAEIAGAGLVFLAGLADRAAADIVRIARDAGVLVNVEDDARCSDFHSASVVRRGDLILAISTNGKSPGLAAVLRRILERSFDAGWGGRLDEIAALRRGWRAAGADIAAVGRRTEEWAGRHGWLAALPGSSHGPRRPVA